MVGRRRPENQTISISNVKLKTDGLLLTTIAAALLLLPAKITCLSGQTRTSSFVSPGAVGTDLSRVHE